MRLTVIVDDADEFMAVYSSFQALVAAEHVIYMDEGKELLREEQRRYARDLVDMIEAIE